MTALKKTSLNPYKLAAAARRTKVASTGKLIVGEVKPTLGRIRVTLSGRAITRSSRPGLFGQSSIDIPEFSNERKRKSA